MSLKLLENEITSAVERLSASVVSISSVRIARDMRFGVVPIEGEGSGVIIDSNGYIVTNNHVIDGASRVQVNLKDGRSHQGEVVGVDPSTDVALIRVDAPNLPAAGLGDSEQLKVGQIVLAIGNALGLQGAPTVSMGVISALKRPLPGVDSIFEGLIQTDAAINPGNSGGPLADLNGNIVGINTMMIPYAQGVGFAIPVNTVKDVTQQLFTKGRVVRPWLGVTGVDLNPALVRRYNLPAESGVLVVEVSPNSPSEAAGLQSGDIITGIGIQDVKKMKDLLQALSKLPVGKETVISYLRWGRERKSSIRLIEAPVQTARRSRR
jgi:serine protease Do